MRSPITIHEGVESASGNERKKNPVMHFLLLVFAPMIGTTQSVQTLPIAEGSYGTVSSGLMIWFGMCARKVRGNAGR